MRSRILLLPAVLLVTGCGVHAADLPKPKATPGRVMLPQEHQYQRVLRKYMATLTEKDFAHGVTEKLTVKPSSQDPEYRYRNYILTLMHQPLVGTQRGYPSVNAPARLFTLPAIEAPDAVMAPPAWPETLISFVQWDYPGNPYHDNRALKLRAFTAASVNLMMLDDYLEKNPKVGRSDWYAYQLVYLGSPYPGFQDLLPPEVRRAYRTGLLKMGRRIIEWGPKGEEPNLDTIAPIGLWYVSKACDDAAFTKDAEGYARMMFTDPKYFHPAGYFVDRGGIDVGFGGMANFFAVWTALASDWDFAKQAVNRIYRLRAHLCLREPDGGFTGPSAFNSRIGSDAWSDQWAWNGARDHAASLLTDEAAYLVKLPGAEELSGAAGKRADVFNHHIKENWRKRPSRFDPETGYWALYRNDELRAYPWEWRMWFSWDFPASVNPGYEFYRKGAYAHRVRLEKENSPYLKSPFERGETFVRDFAKAFTVARQPSYAAIVHTGPVGRQDPEDALLKFAGPLGFGGGQLAAFWTPATGSVVLARRGGVTIKEGQTVNYDEFERWRAWPIHAATGMTIRGKVFTSARILDPHVASEIDGTSATVKASGVIPTQMFGQGKALDGQITYARTFKIAPDKVSVETKVTGDGKDKVSELYETLPVFLGDGPIQTKAAATTIDFQSGGKWAAATDKYQEKVTAVRVKRFKGAVRITFDRPRRVKLSPADWKDTFLSRASCRNILIDLLAGGGGTAPKNASIAYTIAPEGAP